MYWMTYFVRYFPRILTYPGLMGLTNFLCDYFQQGRTHSPKISVSKVEGEEVHF